MRTKSCTDKMREELTHKRTHGRDKIIKGSPNEHTNAAHEAHKSRYAHTHTLIFSSLPFWCPFFFLRRLFSFPFFSCPALSSLDLSCPSCPSVQKKTNQRSPPSRTGYELPDTYCLLCVGSSLRINGLSRKEDGKDRERERERERFGEHLLHPTLCIKSFGA